MNSKMNKKKMYLMVIIISGCLMIINGCTKSEDSSVIPATASCSDGIQNQGETGIDCGGPCSPCIPSTNPLCDGNGTLSYYPLKLGNKWSYTSSWENYTHTVTDSLNENGLIYYEVTYKGIGTDEIYLRTDLSNNNVYSRVYNSALDSFIDYLFVPGSPVLNQEWDFALGFGMNGKRKVTKIDAAITQSGCVYTGLLEIKDYDSGGTYINYSYFKKGLGVIKDDVAVLKSVILK